MFYTAPFGSSLDISYDIDAHTTDTSNLDLFANNGNGIAINIDISTLIKNYTINFYLKDYLSCMQINLLQLSKNEDSNFKELKKSYKIPYGKHILVHDGDNIYAGDRLCEGSVSPRDILKISENFPTLMAPKATF